MINFFGTEISFMQILTGVLYLVFAPVIGCLIAGIDRKITARMQGRFGPPILQPYYDMRKLFAKEAITVRGSQELFVVCCLIFMIITGLFFFAGGNLLMVIFTLTMASVFLIVAGFSSNSPFSQIGAERELLLMMTYEPMVLLMAVGLYLVNGSFDVSEIVMSDPISIIYLAGMFIGYMYVLTMKFRKSPFDLSMSHHAHQELVKGLTTEFSGGTMAVLEIVHWYENVLLLGFVFLFFSNGTVLMVAIGVVACLAMYFLEIIIDNGYARMKWQFAFKSGWIMTIIFGGVNLIVLYYLKLFGLIGA
ncbi:MAG: NADH-quinone oxidoreductase subunit H [Clostridiales Family XIII bacterium]|jgi:formate hydrogenlyase subunit 4|nr:NADH-quinone oxidoreductase subunit H [Clostridiales Family XIII bacterium]